MIGLKKVYKHRKLFFCACLTNGNSQWIMGKYLNYCLSKAFDCLSHGLLIVKLHTYGFSFAAFRLMYSYLKTKTKYLVQIQRSMLGPLLFDLFLCDTLFVMSETKFAGYADSNAPYVAFDNVDDVTKILENDSIRLFK